MPVAELAVDERTPRPTGGQGRLPGGQLALAKTAVEAGKIGTNVGLAGLVGVVGSFDQSKLIHSGAIKGSLHGDTLKLDWDGPQQSGIPMTVSLQYINKLVKISEPTVETLDPWTMDAKIDDESGDRFAFGEDAAHSTKGEVTESSFAYWSATRVD